MSISGNLRTMPFADILQWVSQSRKTGTLAVEGEPYNKKIYFRDGLVVAAASDNPKEFLGYYLVGWGYVSEDELHELLDMQDRHGTLLGELLVIVGHLSREELVNILLVKTEEAIYELFLWDEGDFRFLENILPAKKFQPLGVAVDTLVLEGVRRRDEWLRCRQTIPDASWVPRVVRAIDVQSMGPTELSILREITGRNSIEEIALACRIPLFHVLLFVYEGVKHGLFQILEPKPEAMPIPGFSAGSWRVLLREAERLLEAGELSQVMRYLDELREKYGSRREIVEHLVSLEQRVEERIAEIGIDEAAVPELAIPLAQLTSLSCSPLEGFLLSRINGMYTLGEILKMVPGSPIENLLLVDGLLRRNVIRVRATSAIRKAT